MRAIVAALLLIAGCQSCSDDDSGQALPVAPVPDRPDVIAPRAVATRFSFDLVQAGEASVFVWSPPFGEGGGIRMIRVGAMGAPLASETPVFAPRSFDEHPPDAFEVRAAVGGGRLAVAWVQRQPFARAAYVVHGPDTGAAFSPPVSLTQLPLDHDPIGAVSAAAMDDGTLRVMFRGRDGPCPSGAEGAREAEPCARVHFRQVPVDQPPSSGREPLVVPAACDRPFAGYFAVGRVWYYALCSGRADERSTTVYAIDPDLPYAHAETGLVNAVPLGLAPLEDGAIVFGEHPGGISALTLVDGGRRVETLASVRRRVECADPPRLVAESEAGERELTLAAPVDRLAAWLPTEVAPAPSRAVWTGEAILVATSQGGDVTLRRYQCRYGRLERTDML